MKLTGVKWTLLGEAGRAAIGALTFFLLARALGVGDFGIVAATSALVAFSLPIVSIGTVWLTQADATTSVRERTAAHLTLALLIMTPASLLVGLVASLSFDLTYRTAVIMVWADLVAQWFITTLASSHLGKGLRFGYFAWLLSAFASRLIASISTFFWLPSVEGWAMSSAAASLTTAFIACWYLRLRPSTTALTIWYRTRWRRGIAFSSVGTSTALIDTGDQYLMGTVLGSTAAGQYGFAWRLASYTLIPVRGICVRAFPEYFAYAERGDLQGLKTFLFRTARLAMGFGVAAAALLYVAASVLVPALLPDFDESLPVLLVLLVPMGLRSWHYSLGDVLYAFDAAKSRLFAVWGAAVIGLPISVFAMLHWGAMGAAAASVVSELVAIGLLGTAVSRNFRRAEH